MIATATSAVAEKRRTTRSASRTPKSGPGHQSTAVSTSSPPTQTDAADTCTRSAMKPSGCQRPVVAWPERLSETTKPAAPPRSPAATSGAGGPGARSVPAHAVRPRSGAGLVSWLATTSPARRRVLADGDQAGDQAGEHHHARRDAHGCSGPETGVHDRGQDTGTQGVAERPAGIVGPLDQHRGG